MKEHKFKVGDTVQRIKGGSHGGIDPYVPFVVTLVAIDGNCRDDVKGSGHDPNNLELVKTAEPVINNNYSIY